MPTSEPTTLEELYELLHGAVVGTGPDQRLTLSAALLAAAGELVAHLGLTELELAQRPDATGDLVRLEGDHVAVAASAVLFPAGKVAFTYDVALAGTCPGAAALALDATPAATVTDWTFAGNFAADFPPYLGTAPAEPGEVADPTLGPQPSFLPGAVFTTPAFRVATETAPAPTGLTFSGTLDVAQGSLKELADLFLPAQLPAHGPVVVRPGTYPLVELSLDTGYSIPKLADVSAAVTVVDADGATAAATDFALVGQPTAPGIDDITISAPLLQGQFLWRLTGETHDPAKYSVASGLGALGAYAGMPLTLPTGFDALGQMYLRSVDAGFRPSAVPALDQLGFTIATDPARNTLWSIPILGLAFQDLGVQWSVIGLASGAPTMLGTVSGVFVVGSGPDAARLDAAVDVSGTGGAQAPDAGFSLSLDPTTELPVKDLFRVFTGQEVGIPLTITDLLLEGRTGTRSLQFVVALEPTWDLPVPGLEVNEVTLAFRSAPNAFTATLGLQVTLLELGFMVGATYRGDGKGWLLSGGLLPASQGTALKDMLAEVDDGYFPEELPAGLGDVELRNLTTSFDTTSTTFTFDGTVGWPFTLLGLDVDLEAQLSLTKRKETAPEGFVRGALTIDAFRAAVTYAFGVENNRTITFEIGWKGATLTCIASENAKGETILRANLGGVSFGDLVAWLAGLGGAEVTLSAPWDVLYRVTFDALWLEVNLTTKAIGARYDVGLDLGFVRVDTVGLTYRRRAGAPSLDLSITGAFAGTEYPADDPLGWDVINDPAPAPPGKADALLDLRFLALGQNVAFRDTSSFTRIADVLAALEADFAPVDPDASPLEQLSALRFSGDGNWLIGVDFTLMSAVSLSGIFADPSLYGVRIGLAGERVKSLAGLELEILYRKISDTVGVYHIELTLPEAMRQLTLGVVSVTIPTITVDIYTNGNFRIDLGFPADGDWSRSFCLQAGYFIGYGGFYFALLDGTTSSKVPAITNGAFSPVIEFGVGLQVGVGRTLDKGVLKAGATLTVQAIVEGVLGWFNPEDRSQPSDTYYWIQGTAAIVGNVYGSVDFVVLKATVSITVAASATLTLEAYRPAEVQLVVRVEVSASLTFLFFTLSFSFSTSLDLSFTLGSGSTPPWRIAADDPVERTRLLAQRTSHRVAPPRPADLLRALRPRPRTTFDWAPPLRGANAAPVDVDLVLLPMLTPAVVAPEGEPATQIVLSLLVPTSTPAHAEHADEVLRVTADAPAEAPFNLLAGGVLRWAIGALSHRLDGDRVTIEELEEIASFLAVRANRDATFTYEAVTGLIAERFRLVVSSPLGPDGRLYDARSDVPRGATATPVQGAMFPMIPEIAMTPQGLAPVTFWNHHGTNADYRAALETYYDQLAVDAGAGGARGPGSAAGPVGCVSGPPPGAPEPADPLRPVSTIVFSDWFALVAQQSVQLAADLLDAYPYRPTGTESLDDVVGDFTGVPLTYRVRPGDTLGSVAARFGLAVEELRPANGWLRAAAHGERLPAGATLEVHAGTSVAKIAHANTAYPLNPGAVLGIGGVRYPVRDGDTLASVAGGFGFADPARLLTEADGINARSTTLLRPGAPLAIPAASHRVTADELGPGDALDRIAAVFYVRARQRAQDAEVREQIAWYVGAIGQLNPQGFTGSVRVPQARLDGGRIVDRGEPTTYVVRPGDTVTDVAAAFALLQLAGEDPAWRAFRGRVTVAPPLPLQAGSIVTLPPCDFPTLAGDTFAAVVEALLLSPTGDLDPLLGGLQALARANAGRPVLAARAVLALPEIAYVVRAGDTLASLAQRFALSLDELAASIAADPGLLTPYDGVTALTVPDVADVAVDDLVEDLARLGSFNGLSTIASRFVLSGMRAPAPGPTGAPEGDLRGLFEVVGQQFPAPGATGATYGIDVENGTGAPWLGFDPTPGERANGAEADGVHVTLTSAFFAAHTPSPVLDPRTVVGPTAMPMHDLVPPRYPLQQSVAWQPATAVPLPGPTGATGSAGVPALWRFPQGLLDRLPAGAGPTATTPPYELVAAPTTTRSDAPERRLERYSWATAIPLTVARAVDASGVPVPGTYELVGTGQSGRDLLRESWQALDALGSGAELYLLREAGPSDAGLISDALDAQRTFVLRTNLSTETHSGGFALGANRGTYYARIADPAAFLRNVWEASVTGTGGFHLTYADAAGRGLSDELFAADGTASLVALLMLDRQRRTRDPVRGLFAFNNCAVLDEGLDPSATRLQVQPVAATAADLYRAPRLPPGLVGFGLVRENPGGATGPADTTRRLHSLVGYQVAGGLPDFAGSHESLPLGPVDEVPAWLPAPPGPTHAYWAYHQVVPVAQFGAVNDCPRSPALPPAADNPYRGITGPTGPGAGGRPLSAVTLDLAYHDVYGNTTQATQPAGSLDVPVGYADELIAVAAWPGSGFAYRFEPADGGGPRLRTTLSLQVDRYLPGSGATLEAAARTAATDAARYRALFYQLQQRDVGFALGANLGSVRLAGDDLGAALRGFVTKAKAFADTTATLRQATARTVAAGETLTAAAARLAATPAALLEANADADAAALLPRTYVRPHLLAAPAMATLAGLAEHPVSREATPSDLPTPVTVARLNLTQPLTPGNVLRTAPQTSLPIPEAAATASLRDLAASLMATVYADVADPDGGVPIAVGLVVENWTAEGLIADGVVLDVDGVELTTSASTFALLHAEVVRERPAFTRGDLAAALAGVEGLLVAGRTLAFATLVVPTPPPPTGPAPAAPRFALRDVPAAAGPLDALATRNRAVTTFFAVGAPLLLGATAAEAAAGDTPRSLARAAAVSLSQLAAFNGDTALGGDVELLLPDVAFLPAPDAAWAAFTPTAADGLGDVAAAVGATPLQVADANRELPGVLRTGAVVTAGETPVTAGPLDSLQSVFLRANAPSWEAFVARLAEPAGAGILRTESALLVPLPAVPESGPDTPAIEAYAAQLRVAPEALLAANVALPGFLRPGVTVRGGATEEVSPPPEVRVGPHDTVLSVQRRLESLGADATLAALVKANAGRTGLLTARARVLLPPAPTELVSLFHAVLPPAGSGGEAAIVFPVDVWVDLTRSRGLVHPDFADTEAIWHARSALVPQLADSADAKVAQRVFATAFEAAFAAQPLKVAVTGEAGAGAAKGRMWAVNFGAGGVSRLAVDAARPMFYALQPLSTTPWGGVLSFPTYASGKGLCADVTKRFQGVDVDAWLRDLLGAIDLALTPGYSVPAFRAGPVSAALGAAAPEPPRDTAAALRTPAAPPPVPDPLRGPVGLETAAQISRPVLGALATGATGCTGPTASGPLDYERLVAAKASIAGALREQVTPIVAAPGATGPWQTEWAREALYQRMLVRLGDGYDTSAIVELPVDVTSPLVTPPPGATGPAPPRVSGKVGPVAHRVAEAPAAATLDEAAGRLSVSAPYLASVLGDVQGILEIGAEIAGQPVGDHDTINQIAARVPIPTDPSAPGYWEPWTAFVAGFAGRPVLVPGAGLPLSALTRMVHGGETLTTIATFFSRDAVSVGRANQDRPGLVRPGPLTAGDDHPRPYPVTAADTLVTIVAGLNAANPGSPPLTVDALCDLLADATPFLATDRALAMVTVLPGLSLSTSKVSLGRVGSRDGVAPPLTFLLNVKDEAQSASLLLNLEYTINELEYAISDVAATGGYQASSWLTFVLALDGSDGGVDARAATAIPQIQVPIPLRAFPPPSVLAGQSGIPSDPGSPLPAQARRWDYRFDVQTRKAAQDTDHLLVRFGEQTGGLRGATSLAGLLRWLAAYVDAAPTLSDDLARLPQLRPGAVDPVAAHAFQALSLIAAGVGDALSARSFAAPAGPTAAQTLAYEMTALTDGTQLKTLRLTPEAPGPTGARASWPDVLVASPTAPTGEPGPDAGFLPMEGTAGRYRYPGGVVAADAQTYRFRFGERDVIRNRNARGSIAVTRNDRLVAAGPLGPTGAPGPVPTTEGFIYRTPFVGFQEPLVPLLEADATIDVAALGTGPVPRPLRDHVLALLLAATDVAPGSAAAPVDVELAAAYGSLVGDMLIRTPVLLVPARTLTGAEVGAFASELATSLAGWHRASQIASDAGLLAFELTVFATDQGSDAARRPILRFTDLRLSLADIAWPPDTKDER